MERLITTAAGPLPTVIVADGAKRHCIPVGSPIANYEKKTGVKVKLSFGASGALTQQIQNGAPFDLFFSADMDCPRQLIASGEADGASSYQYAVEG
jgi:molybdate transport system substrate-binding protein